MIRRNPAVPDNIFELKRHETFGDYARTYGDEITRRYEDLNIVYIPFFPLNVDIEFLRSLTFPPRLKKVGTVDGIDKNIFERKGTVISLNDGHVLRNVFAEPALLGYLQQQVSSANWQIRMALQTLFPRYHSLNAANITWRMTETINEGMHVDGFGGGRPTPGRKGVFHRVKLFVNIDSEPRKWWTSFTMPEILKRYRDQFPDAVADDADMLTYRISGRPFLEGMPYHEIDIPPMGAVMAEASAICHAVRYGRRMVAAECGCLASDMLDPGKTPQARLAGWLKDVNIAIDENAGPVELSAAAKAYEKENAGAL